MLFGPAHPPSAPSTITMTTINNPGSAPLRVPSPPTKSGSKSQTWERAGLWTELCPDNLIDILKQ